MAEPGTIFRKKELIPCTCDHGDEHDEPFSIQTPENLIRKTQELAVADKVEDVKTEHTGLTHECGVFGCIATGDWPSPQVDVAQVICLGLVALQHR